MPDLKDTFLLFLGGLIGVLFAVLLQDKLNERKYFLVAKFRNFLLSLSGVNKLDFFSLRGHPTSIHIIDGDGRLSYSPETVNFRFVDPPSLPADIIELISKVEEREADKKERGFEPSWNGAQLGIASFDIGRSKDEMLLTISAAVFRSDYFTFLATCGALRARPEKG